MKKLTLLERTLIKDAIQARKLYHSYMAKGVYAWALEQAGIFQEAIRLLYFADILNSIQFFLLITKGSQMALEAHRQIRF